MVEKIPKISFECCCFFKDGTFWWVDPFVQLPLDKQLRAYMASRFSSSALRILKSHHPSKTGCMIYIVYMLLTLSSFWFKWNLLERYIASEWMHVKHTQVFVHFLAVINKIHSPAWHEASAQCETFGTRHRRVTFSYLSCFPFWKKNVVMRLKKCEMCFPFWFTGFLVLHGYLFVHFNDAYLYLF